MTDTEIIELYWTRSEAAIARTAARFGKYCMAISMNILKSREDAEECVNDTYLSAWNKIPPQRPAAFSAFLGRITRNLSLDRYRARTSKKRGGGEIDLLLSELDECIPSAGSVESSMEKGALGEIIDRFLSEISAEERIVFVRRYWYGDSISNIARRFSVGEGKVRTGLFRTRNKLKDYFEKEGAEV